MNRRILYAAVTLSLIALGIILWKELVPRPANSGGNSESDERLPVINAGSDSRIIVPQPPSQSNREQDKIRSGSKVTSDLDRRKALEALVAAQEKLVAEKRAALSRYILTNAVVYRESAPPNGPDFDGVVDDQDLKRGNEVGGFVDLKKELEMELENLERLKANLK